MLIEKINTKQNARCGDLIRLVAPNERATVMLAAILNGVSNQASFTRYSGRFILHVVIYGYGLYCVGK